MARPPITREELAGREAARRAEPMSDATVEALLRMWRPYVPPAPARSGRVA